MITKCTRVYAGDVDLPDRGRNATLANERRYSNEHLATVFDKTEAIAKKTDALGFDILWLAEHHFQHEGDPYRHARIGDARTVPMAGRRSQGGFQDRPPLTPAVQINAADTG